MGLHSHPPSDMHTHLRLEVAVENVPVMEIDEAHGQLRNPVQRFGLWKQPARFLLLFYT